MFRNSYLETYKNAVLQNKEADFLFVHLSQIYATLGLVISDLEFQFSLILAKSQNNQKDKSQRNSTKSPPYLIDFSNHPAPNSNHENQFEQIQNKLMNYANFEKKTVPETSFELKPNHFEKQAKKKVPESNLGLNDKVTQRSSSPYNHVIESTQDFDALFLNPKEEYMNVNVSMNSNSRPQPPKSQIKGKDSAGNQQKGNKKADDSYLDKLFGN